ncbi:MAG: hypothetical protein CME62_13100 [Halobacteriovoraceae bacterium]|nr:hypothetical protein [Halobacteriovoraceae bacterium]|tara:strand:- start:21788 stop:22909 length:1122 start_codon:yes stop_codon:yes gene_type:complete
MKKNLNRRKLIQLAVSGFLAQSCKIPGLGRDIFSFFDKGKEKTSSKTNEYIYSGYRVGEPYKTEEVGLHIGGVNHSLNKKVKLKNEIHSIVYSPQDDSKLFISKLDKYSYCQRGEGEFIEFSAVKDHYFYGHAAFDNLRNVIYTTQAKITKNRHDEEQEKSLGKIFIYSVDTLEVIGEFETFGSDPHDLKIVNDELVVCNGGVDSNVAFINLETKKLVKSFPINEENISLRHCEIIDSENFIIASLSRNIVSPCGIYLLNKDKGFIQYRMPKKLEEALALRQFLSVLYYNGVVFATCPAANNVLAWKLTGEFIGAHSITSANNLSYSPTYKGVIVGTGLLGSHAHLLKVIDQNVVVSKLNHLKDLTGSHATII